MKDCGNFWQKKPKGANADTKRSGLIAAGLGLILSLGQPVFAGEIFHWQDRDGHSHYADHPAQGARQFVLPREENGSVYRVKRVYDGDTLQLVSGEKVRLLAINTPEIEHPHKAGEAGGEEARQWLQKRLDGQTVRLETDTEVRDHYGRLLAHVYAGNGEHINLSLVRQGLAFVDVYPPNIKHVAELLAAEQEAERAGRGVWQRPEYARKPVSALTELSPHGWQRLTGRVTRIEDTRTYRKLILGETFEANIPKHNLSLFPPPDSYLNQPLEIRGLLYRYQNRHAMQLRHPAAIRALK